ncbi:MAG TPA: reverse transcriptase domain-containing protein [Candidatus Koribacter sp.]
MPLRAPIRKLLWNDVYREVDLYKAALRVYTKPLFGWRKALFTSSDGRTLYDLAAHGLPTLDRIDRELRHHRFTFRPSVALQYNFNGKHRTLYIAPWEERIVDLLLYRILTTELQDWYSPSSYAYRERRFGLDRCQSRIAQLFRTSAGPLFAIKRDISNYFASVNHDLLLAQLRELVSADDYLFHLLQQRVAFAYNDADGEHRATLGIPLGAAVACAFANIYLTPLDRQIESIQGVHYFRYADDLLAIAPTFDAACEVRERMVQQLEQVQLRTKATHELDLALKGALGPGFHAAIELRHLGLQFSETGSVGLSRDKSRKIQNLFRFAFRRSHKRWKKLRDPQQRAQALVQISAQTIDRGVRNVAIIDYYLKHLTDERRLKLIDRWLAEEILASVFGGHKKKHFQRLSFTELRSMGLPSLVHRRRLILRKEIESPFFVWQHQKAQRAFRGTVARA